MRMIIALNATRQKTTRAQGRFMRCNQTRQSKDMEEELTINVELSQIALKLRTLRLQKGFSMKVVSKVCKVGIDDLYAWEMGKVDPPKEVMERLISFYS